MLNLAGSSYDFGNVLFAVLQECEHRRRALLPNEAEQGLMDIARRKLEEVRASYEEAGGSRPYWEDLEREVLKTTMPQYIPAAVEQTRLEQSNYDVWRRADVAARAAFALLGLAIGALILWARIPVWEKGFAFLLAGLCFVYPEVKKAAFDFRHSRFLNKLITQAEEYQKNSRIHYVTNARLEEEFRALGKTGEAFAAPVPSSEPREGLRLVQTEPPSPSGSGQGQRTRG